MIIQFDRSGAKVFLLVSLIDSEVQTVHKKRKMDFDKISIQLDYFQAKNTKQIHTHKTTLIDWLNNLLHFVYSACDELISGSIVLGHYRL